MYKGAHVRVHGVVATMVVPPDFSEETWNNYYDELIYKPRTGNKGLFRHTFEGSNITGRVIGYTFRFTGSYQASSPEYGDFGSILGYEPAYLDVDRGHRVWLVETDWGGNRYYEPFVCLEEDLELLDA